MNNLNKNNNNNKNKNKNNNLLIIVNYKWVLNKLYKNYKKLKIMNSLFNKN